MKVAALYVLTGLVTGLHSYYRLTSVVNGAPIDLLSCAALFGSLMLLAGAVFVRSQPRLAARLGLAASLFLWILYAPLIVVSLFMPFSTWFEIRSFISFHEYIPAAGTILGPILLIACTLISILGFRRYHVPSRNLST